MPLDKMQPGHNATQTYRLYKRLPILTREVCSPFCAAAFCEQIAPLGEKLRNYAASGCDAWNREQ